MNFLSISDISRGQIEKIFSIADTLKDNKALWLKEKTFVLFFPESSIRTRLTFEKGIQDLGGRCVLFPPATLDKREALLDVSGYIANWADGIIVRHSDFEKVKELARHATIPVINAMTSYNHPCEILSDLYSIHQLRDDYTALTYTFVGDKGNIANSWLTAAKVFNLKLNHISVEHNRLKADDSNYVFGTVLEDVLTMTDVVLTDPVSEKLRTRAYFDQYQITVERMKRCKPHAILNPCPPFQRGEEVSHDVMTSNYFVGYAFKENLIYLQQAIILYCLGIEII